ncbi:MAG: hypothetical protein CML60_00205, partial [Rhodobacteraceae bacterium]|nr:hypothetical protein [Paracoccaceae bacterium]
MGPPRQQHRRLSPLEAEELADDGRASSRRLTRRERARFLQASFGTQVYVTWDGSACEPSEPQIGALTRAGLWDLRPARDPMPASGAKIQCPKVAGFDQHTNRYCSGGNLAVRYHTDLEVVDNACARKCGDRDVTGVGNFSANADGSPDWCGGNSLDLDKDANAVCLSRAECEQLCTRLPDCVSIDMHRGKPLCYLNRVSCNETETSEDGAFDMLTPYELPTGSSLEEMEDDTVRDAYATETGASCDPLTVEFIGSIKQQPRALCEEDCSADEACRGFEARESCIGDAGICNGANQQCKLFSHCDVVSTQPAIGFGLWEETHPDAVVRRVQAGPCAIVLEGTAFDGEYTRHGPDKTRRRTPLRECLAWDAEEDDPLAVTYGRNCTEYGLPPPHWYGEWVEIGNKSVNASMVEVETYLSADNTSRIRSAVEAQGCSGGWVVEVNRAEPNVTTLFNCSDSLAAADFEYLWKVRSTAVDTHGSWYGSWYLANFDATNFAEDTGPGGITKEFLGSDTPCKAGYERGLCEADPVFRAVCAFTCTPFQQHLIGKELVSFQATTADEACFLDDNETFSYMQPGIKWGRMDHVLPDHTAVYYTRSVMRSCDDDHGFCFGERCAGVPGYVWSHNGDWSGGAAIATTINLGIVGAIEDCADLCSNFAPRSGAGTCLAFWWNRNDGVCSGTADFRISEPVANDALEAYTRCLTPSPDLASNGWNDDDFLAPSTDLTCAAAVEEDPSICFVGPSASIVAAVCRVSCVGVGWTSTTPDPGPDEHAEGHTQEGIGGIPESWMLKEENRRLEHTFALPIKNQVHPVARTVTFLPWDGPWETVLQTWPSWPPNQICSHGVAQPWHWESINVTITPYALLDAAPWFASAPVLEEGASSGFACHTRSVCPEQLRCAIPQRVRLDAEVALLRSRASVGGGAGPVRGEVAVSPAAWVSDLDLPAKDEVLLHLRPKALLGYERAEVATAGGKWAFAQEFFLLGERGTRVRLLEDPGAALLTLVTASAAAEELGRPEADWGLPGLTLLSVLRLEQFDLSSLAPGPRNVTVEVYLPDLSPGAGVAVYRYGPVPNSWSHEPVPVEKLPGGWWRVVLTGHFEYAFFGDVLECAYEICEAFEEVCVETLGLAAPSACDCRPGYDRFPQTPNRGNGYKDYLCVRPEALYDPADHDFYLQVESLSRHDYGWEISEIRLKGSGCGNLPRQNGRVPTTWNSLVDFPESSTPLGVYLKRTRIYTGPVDEHVDKVEYPGGTRRSVLFDNKQQTKWFSHSLLQNPRTDNWPHDETHPPLLLEMIVKGNSGAECLEIDQGEERVSARKLRVTRGPAKGANCGMAEGQDRCLPLKTWEVELPPGETSATIDMSCGAPGMIIGELVEDRFFAARVPNAGTDRGPSTGIPTPCDCEQYCADVDGCRTYRWSDGHCYLQGAALPTGSRSFGYEGRSFVSGTLPARVHAVEATPTSLVLHGVNLPAAGTGAARAQRVKLVAPDQDCFAPLASTVQGITCVRHTQDSRDTLSARTYERDVCSPGPSKATDTAATWDRLDLRGSYKVCYCLSNCGTAAYVQVGRVLLESGALRWRAAFGDGVGAAAGSTPFVLQLSRAAFSSWSSASTWTVRLVPQHDVAYDGKPEDVNRCAVGPRPNVGVLEPTGSTVVGPDTVTFDFDGVLSAYRRYYYSATAQSQLLGAAGYFFVCAAEGSQAAAITPQAETGEMLLQVPPAPEAGRLLELGWTQGWNATTYSSLGSGVALTSARVPVVGDPTKVRAVLSSNGCGMHMATIGRPALGLDTTAPELVPEFSGPDVAAEQSDTIVVALRFDELLGPCHPGGTFYFVDVTENRTSCDVYANANGSSATGTYEPAEPNVMMPFCVNETNVTAVPCEKAVVVADTVLVAAPTSLPNGEYQLRGDRGSVVDLYGNTDEWWTTGDLRWTVNKTSVREIEVLTSSPRHQTNTAGSTVTMFLSEIVGAVTGPGWLDCSGSFPASELVDCGVDQVCSTADDQTIALLPFFGNVTACDESGNLPPTLRGLSAPEHDVFIFNQSATLRFTNLKPGGRYTWVMRSGSLVAGMGLHRRRSTSFPETRLDFLVSGFDELAAAHGAPLVRRGLGDMTQWDRGGVSFAFSLPSGPAVGEYGGFGFLFGHAPSYDVCWCNPHADTTLRPAVDEVGKEAGYVYQAAKLPGQCAQVLDVEVLDVALSNVNITGQPLADHLCSVKCPACVGAECYCESPSDGALCLPEPLCRAA